MTTATDTSSQRLTTGWETGVDPGDTVLRRFLLHLGEYFSSAAAASCAPVLRDDDLVVADLRRPSGFLNSAVLLQPPPPSRWDDVLDRVEAAFADGTGDALLWSAWPTPDLRERGWQLMGHPPLLVRQPGGALPPAAPGLHVREIRHEAGLEDWARVAVEGFPFDELLPYRAGSLLDARVLHDHRWRFWVGYEDTRPVAIGTLFVSHGFAQLALGVSLAEARGRGFWYTLVRERLLAEPDLLSGAVFSDDSRPGIERLGYLPIVRLTLWHRHRPAVPFTSLSP
jgi:hypothetical protein